MAYPFLVLKFTSANFKESMTHGSLTKYNYIKMRSVVRIVATISLRFEPLSTLWYYDFYQFSVSYTDSVQRIC